MRVLIVTTQDSFFLSHVRERAEYFKNMGAEVGVAAQKTSDSLVQQIESLGIPFFDTKLERKSLNPITQLKALFRLFFIQRSFKPNISYHLGAKAIFYGTATARIYNKKVAILNAPIGLGYVFASNQIKARLLRPVVISLYRLFLNPTNSRVIIENWDDINFFVKKGILNQKDAYCILGAGVDTNHFSPGTPDDKNSVCTVVMASRLIKEKGVNDFVEVAEKLFKENIPVRMQLIGLPDYGNPSSLSRQEYEKLKLNPAVECLGYHRDIAPFLRKAHICCLPSFYREGLPRVLVEAASAGLAILTTDVVGCRESVRGENGFLFHPHDNKKLFHFIYYLVRNPHILKKMGQNSRSVALEFFDTRLICKRTYDVAIGLFNSRRN